MTLNAVDQAFHDTYSQLLNEGHLKSNRTGVDTMMLPAMSMKFDLRGGKNPWPSTKELRDQKLREEMEWFISGSSSIKFLRDRKNGIWDDWFMPGTAVYDEPKRRELTLQDRIDVMVARGNGPEVKKLVEQHLAKSGLEGATTLYVTNPDGTRTFWDGLPHYFARELGAHFTEAGVPLYVMEGGGKPVSLKKRLSRVSKNDSERWTQIRWNLSEFHCEAAGVETTLSIWSGTEFVETDVNYDQTTQLWSCLNRLSVPAYPLLDADIGAGGYGPQWRRWRDTQIVNCRYGDPLFKKYEEQGYTFRGTLDYCAEETDTGHSVFSREIDQLQNCIDKLRTNPDDRRILVTAWNPGLLWQAALPPCHLYFQFMTNYRTGQEVYADLVTMGLWSNYSAHYVVDLGVILEPDDFIAKFDTDAAFREATEAMLNREDFRVATRHLHCLLVMRSSDTPLGTPFNVAQYALLVHLVAHVTNMEAASLTWVGGDSHIYVNQIDAIKEQLSRDSMPDCDVRIQIERDFKEIDDFKFDDVSFSGYSHRGFLDIPVAV
jgi:thymidylate synthase